MFADNAAATARGTFLGEDTADPNASGTAIYTELTNLPTAVSSILQHSQKRANFNPATLTPEALAAAFNGYVTEIGNNPFFGLLTNNTTKQTFESKDYNLLIDQISNLYTGVSSKDLQTIKTAIADMAKSVFGQEHSQQWKNLFSQSTIDMSNLSQPKLYVYYTALYMAHDKNGKSEVSKQSYEVRRTEFSVLTLKIKANAGRLVALDTTDVNGWLDNATSPTNAGRKLCFEA